VAAGGAPGAARAAAEPAEVDGEPITLEHLRTLLEQLDAVCPGGLQAPTGGTLGIGITSRTGQLLGTTTRAELARILRRGCTTHPDVACSCPLLQRPPRIDRYEPTPAQRRWVTTRDRGCRFPHCGNRAGWSDLDHVVAHADGGETDCGNLCCLCRRHHRLKTHSPGWTFVMGDDGVLRVTTPSGVTRTTRPPGVHRPRVAAVIAEPPRADDDPPPF
jgi:hypothetical protein